MGQLHCGMCEIGPINSHTQTQNYIWWFVSFTLNWNVILTCSSLVAPQVVKHYCSQWWHFVKMTTFPFKCTAVSGYRIALNPKLRWSLSLKILKDRAHLLAFKFFILGKFSCFIVLLFFFCYFPIIRTDSCVISWKITFFKNFISCHIFAIYVGGACFRLPAACRLIVLLHKSQCALRYLDPMSKIQNTFSQRSLATWLTVTANEQNYDWPAPAPI